MLDTVLRLAVPILLGLCAASAGTLGILFGAPILATLALLALAATDLARRSAWRMELAFLGGAVGIVVASRQFAEHGFASAIVPGVLGLLILVADRLVAVRTPLQANGTSSPAALLAIGFALATALEPAVATTLRILGSDGSTLTYATAPLLLLAAGGAGALRFVARRHPEVAGIAITALAIVTLVSRYVLAPGPDDWLARATALQAPTVSRSAFLCGASLLAVAAALLPIVGLSGLLTLLGRTSQPTLRYSYLALGVACGLHVPGAFALPASLAAIVAACVPRLPRKFAIPVLATGSLALGGALLRPPTELADFVLRDPVWQYDGTIPEPTPRSAANGRPESEPDPPGWPFQMDPFDALFALLRRGVPDGAIGLLGDEAGAVAARAAESVRQRLVVLDSRQAPGTGQSVRIVLPSCFSERLRYFTNGLVGASQQSTLVIVALDLAEVDRETVKAVARISRDGNREAALFLHGRHAFILSAESSEWSSNLNVVRALSAIARAPLPVLALSDQALARFAPAEARSSEATLLLGGGRTRLAHRSPRLAAANLRALLAFADALDGDRNAPAPFTREPRVRLMLAAAILDDDAEAEDRLLTALDLLGSEDAPRLRVQRGNAREAVLERLLELRDSDREKNNADVHFRLGRLLARRGDTLAALIGLTRTIELRSQFGEGWVALAEAFADAEEKGEQRVENGVVLAQNTIPWQFLRQFAEIDDPLLLARVDRVFGRAHFANARNAKLSQRSEELSFAMARFHLAWTADPSDNAGLVHSSRVLAAASEPTALNFARLAVDADPLSLTAWQALADCASEPQERERALRSVLALSGRPPE